MTILHVLIDDSNVIGAKEVISEQLEKLDFIKNIVFDEVGDEVMPKIQCERNYLCPCCGRVIGDCDAEQHYYDYCPCCGTKIYWGGRCE